jgi:nucleotide-binding universal stress UspA family protein
MNILVGYDGSNAAKDALKLAQKHAKAYGAKIDVVKSVTSNDPLSPSLFQTAEEELGREIRNHFNGSKISYETHLLVSSRSSGENLV